MMNNEIGKSNPIKLSTQLLYFMDYKIHEYSPEELYDNKVRLFESLMIEWNNMNTKEQEKYSQKMRLTNGGEKVKQRKDESFAETMYETADEKPTKSTQQIKEEIESLEISGEKQSNVIIKESQNKNNVVSKKGLKQGSKITYGVISDKETNSQQYRVKSQQYLNQESIQEEQKIDEKEEEQNNYKENSTEGDKNIDNFKQNNEIDEQSNQNKGKKSGLSQKQHFQKGSTDKMKQQVSKIKKRAISISKQNQLNELQNQNNFSINETLTLKQLKDKMKILFQQIE